MDIMNGITTEDVRGIVQQENRVIEKTLIELAKESKKTTEAMNKTAEILSEVVTQTRVNDEKFARLDERIDAVNQSVVQAHDIQIEFSKTVLPQLEINSFGVKVLWKIALSMFVPTAGMFVLFYKMQSEQTKVIADAILEMGKLIVN